MIVSGILVFIMIAPSFFEFSHINEENVGWKSVEFLFEPLSFSLLNIFLFTIGNGDYFPFILSYTTGTLRFLISFY